MNRSEAGFTLIEVMIAIIVLSVGALAMAGTSAAAIRMVGQGKRSTQAAVVAAARFETLRATARTTTPLCTALTNGNASAPHGMSEAWTVSGAGPSRSVRVIVSYRGQRSAKADTIQAILGCK